MLQFLAAQTETKIVWPGVLSGEQTAISLFRDRGLNTVTSPLILRRYRERHLRESLENKSPPKMVFTEPITQNKWQRNSAQTNLPK